AARNRRVLVVPAFPGRRPVRRGAVALVRREGGCPPGPGGTRTWTAAGPCFRSAFGRAVLASVLTLLTPLQSAAQIDGSASVSFGRLPDVSERAGAQAVGELRARVFAERALRIGENVRVHLSAYGDGLVRRGGEAASST